MKTLIVKYLPTGEKSNTKKILDLFLQQIKGQEIETVDLLNEKLPIFNLDSMQAYYKRNYGGVTLDEKEANLLKENDRLIKQFKSADIFVMAFPMHNFGFPAAAKAYLDAVIFNGETFSPGKKIMAGRKALTIFSSGGIYSENVFNFDYPNWNSIALLAKANFTFMGFDESETIGTSLRDPATEGERLNAMSGKIKNIVGKWYS